jgi:hypothetical protein
MPAVASGGGGDELGPGDEIKVFKDEGEDEQEQGGSESLQAELLEEKSSLITESEQVRQHTFIYCQMKKSGNNFHGSLVHQPHRSSSLFNTAVLTCISRIVTGFRANFFSGFSVCDLSRVQNLDLLLSVVRICLGASEGGRLPVNPGKIQCRALY